MTFTISGASIVPMELKKLQRDEFLGGKRGQWCSSNDKRGNFCIRDDDETMSISIGGYCSGATVEERLDWLKIAIEWTLGELNRFSEEEVIARIDNGVITDGDIAFTRRNEAELKNLTP